MDTNETPPADTAIAGPRVQCLALPDFDDADLEGVRRAFQPATPCPLGQAWQPELSPGFAPAEVRVGWREQSLLVFAELTDTDIHSSATAENQRMWELGDTFEMFLQPEGQESYVEFHVTPNNHRLQLRIENIEALRRAQADGVISEFVLPGQVFHSTTWVQPEARRWFVLADIPAAVVCEGAGGIVGSRWHYSFSRYDYTHGSREPVISSTSPHSVADFHRQQEWGVLGFEPQS